MAYNRLVFNIEGEESLIFDISDTTAEAADVATGKYFYDKNGARKQGTHEDSGGGSYPGVDVIYDELKTISTTSTSNVNQVTISADLTKYDSVTMYAIPQTKSATANALLGAVSSLIKTTATYPNAAAGRYVYLSNGAATSAAVTSTSGYGLFLYPASASSLYIRSRCRNSYVTSISGSWRLIVIGCKYT